MKKKLSLLLALLLTITALSGCMGSSNTVQGCVISDTAYANITELDTAAQPETLDAGSAVYASVYFIESPAGMEYTVKWYLDGTELKAETKAIEKDGGGVLVYELEAEKAEAGALKAEVLFRDTVLFETELPLR